MFLLFTCKYWFCLSCFEHGTFKYECQGKIDLGESKEVSACVALPALPMQHKQYDDYVDDST